MEFVGRTRQLGALRGLVDRREASVIRVTGLRGAGKSALVRRVVADFPHLLHAAPPLPDRIQRAALMGAVSVARTQRGRAPHLSDDAPSWAELLGGLLDIVPSGGRPFALVLDDVHRLGEARARYLGAVVDLVEAARVQGRPLHVVLVGPADALPDDDDLPWEAAPASVVGPLPFRAAAALLPGTRPHDLLRAYGALGGIPRVLAALDRDVALGTNLRRLLFSPEAPLSDAGGLWLERDVQAPSRYYAVLRALARGDVDWGGVHAAVPDLTRSGQLAPYLGRLESLGLVTSRRSLDAGPRSRARRYALADPFLATWLRFVLGAPSLPDFTTWSDHFATRVRPELDHHLARFFPMVCRQHMAFDALETFGGNAREGGSLWGSGYDIPVAGILSVGAAYYGSCAWTPSRRDDEPLKTLDAQVRETRYGFGRQSRLRIVFTGHDAPAWLQREIARRHDAYVIDAEALLGA